MTGKHDEMNVFPSRRAIASVARSSRRRAPRALALADAHESPSGGDARARTVEREDDDGEDVRALVREVIGAKSDWGRIRSRHRN